jgi:hypothetical protein
MEHTKRSRLETGLPQRTPWRAVVFDLDETTGSWGLGSLAFQVFTRYGGNPSDLIVPFVAHYLEQGGARPWLRELLKGLSEWKRAGRIDEVAIFTAASNQYGWVHFLRDCMEVHAGVPGLFGRVISREDSPLVATPDGARTVKDLSLLGDSPNHLVLIDDKPQFALNGYVIGVPEYTQDVCSQMLESWIAFTLPTYAAEIQAIFAADRLKHPTKPTDFSQDTAHRDTETGLNMVFPETPSMAAQAALAVDEMLTASNMASNMVSQEDPLSTHAVNEMLAASA